MDLHSALARGPSSDERRVLKREYLHGRSRGAGPVLASCGAAEQTCCFGTGKRVAGTVVD